MHPLRTFSISSIVSPEAASGGAAAWTEMTEEDTLPDHKTQAEKSPCLRPAACNRNDLLQWRVYETEEIDEQLENKGDLPYTTKERTDSQSR